LIALGSIWLETGDFQENLELLKALHCRKLELRFLARIFFLASEEDSEASIQKGYFDYASGRA